MRLTFIKMTGQSLYLFRLVEHSDMEKLTIQILSIKYDSVNTESILLAS